MIIRFSTLQIVLALWPLWASAGELPPAGSIAGMRQRTEMLSQTVDQLERSIVLDAGSPGAMLRPGSDSAAVSPYKYSELKGELLLELPPVRFLVLEIPFPDAQAWAGSKSPLKFRAQESTIVAHDLANLPGEGIRLLLTSESGILVPVRIRIQRRSSASTSSDPVSVRPGSADRAAIVRLAFADPKKIEARRLFRAAHRIELAKSYHAAAVRACGEKVLSNPEYVNPYVSEVEPVSEEVLPQRPLEQLRTLADLTFSKLEYLRLHPEAQNSAPQYDGNRETLEPLFDETFACGLASLPEPGDLCGKATGFEGKEPEYPPGLSAEELTIVETVREIFEVRELQPESSAAES